MPPVHWPPGAASTFLILPRSVTRSRHRPAVIGYRGGGSAGALLPGYGPRFVDILRRRARIVDAHVAIKNAVGTSSGQATPAVPPLTSIIPPAAILRSLRLARFKRKAPPASGLGLATSLPCMSKARSRTQILERQNNRSCTGVEARASKVFSCDLETKSL
jgi:hypothetical protein